MNKTKYSKHIAQKICDFVREGHSFTRSCQLVGVPTSTGSDWKKNNSDFSAAVQGAEAQSEHALLETVLNAARSGDTVVTTTRISDGNGSYEEEKITREAGPRYATWILARRFPERWSEQARLQQMADARARQAVLSIMEAVSDDARNEIARVIHGTELEVQEQDKAAV